MKRFLTIVILMSSLVLLLLATPLITAEQSEVPQSDADQIKQLQKERVKVLSNLVQLRIRIYETGIVAMDIGQIVSAETELINAQLDMADNLKERIVLLEDQLKQVKMMLDLTEQRVRGARGSDSDIFWAKSLYLKTQIDLLKERQKLKASSGPNQ